ncbi:MAG: hypothetical protein Q8P40_02255 [Nitrospirota bacterium]|nr:hypothetical protein [Nitrospirota bacterium]
MRKDLIKQIQERRKSRLIVYFTGDRNTAVARIAEDAVRPLYEHLLSVGKTKKIELFLYSRGGDVSVPWRIVPMFREFCNEFSVLIPYKAQSAATLLSLGADKICMGKKAELGPIDPTLMRMSAGESSMPPQEISVEDVNAYISFIREKANINDQSAVAQMVLLLANHLTPLTLGNVNRQNSHIRLVARKLLTSRKEKIDEAKISSIIETLTEKIYSHGHAIGRKEAHEIGLPVEIPDDNQEQALWQLYLEYENALRLNEPIDPLVELSANDKVFLENVPIAVIESENLLHTFSVRIDMMKKRQVPSNPQININVALNLPPGMTPEQVPAQFQGLLQQLVNQVAQQAQQLVQQEIVRQSPEIGINLRVFGGKWQRKEDVNL